MNLKILIGSGDKIMLLTLPFLIVGLALNILYPSLFSVGGPPVALQILAILMLIPGITLWLSSVVLILTKVPKQKLITGGPYALVKHPLYTSVGLLVLPAIGLLFDSWLGVLLGVILYIAARLFAPAEEKMLSKTFGVAWDEYCHKVILSWL